MSSDGARRLRVLAPLLALPPLLALGCHLIQVLRGPAKPSFSHALHVVEKKLDCSDCHPDYETEDRAGMPIMEICEPCHKGLDDRKPPHLRAGAFLVNGEPAWSYHTRLSEEVIFSHRLHHEKGIDCKQCHHGIEESVQVTSRLAIGKPECMGCHARMKASNDCAVCHRSIRKELPPPDHRLNWLQVHGQTVRDGREARAECALCHSEERCSTCHQEVPPRNHTNFFRQRGHGVSVRIDRETCRTCHLVDFCDRCHREVSPRSHTTSFGSPLNRHCLSCHSPLSGEQCFVCHKGTPSHALAPPKPAWHTPAMNCRQCHVAGPTLPHVDNGDNCNGCHQ